MLKSTKQELIETLTVPLILGTITTIAQWLIQNDLVRSLVVGTLLLGILVALLIPQIRVFWASYQASASLNRLIQRTAIQHQFIHEARDLCVSLMPPATDYASSLPPKTGEGTPVSHPALYRSKSEIISLLEHMVRLFELVAPPNTKVWACMRDLRSDDSYHTFVRAGHYTPKREEDTAAMHKDESITVQRLHASYRNNSCVFITGSGKWPQPQMWQPQENDKYKEDLCVMMGAVMTKSRSGTDWENRSMAWILCVCADHEDVFTEHHIPLMQGCVDVFSILANSVLRSEVKSKH